MKKIFAMFGILSSTLPIASCSLKSPIITANPEQQIETKNFRQWCQEINSVSTSSRYTINVLLKKANTDDCQEANYKLNNLTSIELYGSKIIDLKPLSSLIKLTRISLDSNQINDVKPLSSMVNLQYLSLYSNQINDVKPLTNLINLHYLFLGKNEISNVKPLSNLVKLTYLSISYNQIDDVKSLTSLINLTGLDLTGNKTTKKDCPVKPNICRFDD